MECLVVAHSTGSWQGVVGAEDQVVQGWRGDKDKKGLVVLYRLEDGKLVVV